MRSAKVAERLIATLTLMVTITIFVFVAMRLLPGDPVDLILNQGGQVTADQLRALRANYRLDESLWQQVSGFVVDLSRGDLGLSLTYNRPVLEVIRQRVPATIELTFAAVIISLGFSIPAGVISAMKRDSFVDRAIATFSYIGVSVPGFWLGIVLIFIFAVELRWLPTSGRFATGMTPQGPTGFLLMDSLLVGDVRQFTAALRHLILPAFTLGAVMMAIITRVLRSSMIEELEKDYILLARAKGASEMRIVLGHALPNALLPSITIIGLQVGSMLGGNMIVETVFAWPGIGRMAVEGIFARDYPLVQGVVILFAFIFAIGNLMVDLAYAWLNPRITL